ncbi:MAG: CRISPR-associated endonuclease Cas2 [Alphaproteobacteria bacterium]
MAAERLYIVTYDIGDPKRWRRVFRLMKGYGQWLQLSVFQCRLTARRRADLAAALERLIKREEDHVLIIDMGDADRIDPQVESLGRRYETVRREAIII